VGSATSDDAGVYRIDAEHALVQTVDFFTPIVDDPFLYGQIAAANSLSDVYAMGGRPLTAMNVMGMPVELVSEAIINEILKGGAEKVKEARCALAGGHSIKNPEPIYGLSVTGLAHPDRLITNSNARPGDLLVLTKPLGVGILTTGIKRGLVRGELIDRAVALMSRLNTPGSILAERCLVKCATDLTGFGLLGHLGSLCRASGVVAELTAAEVPVLDPEVDRLIDDESCVPGGTKENLESANPYVSWGETVSETQKIILADAQTSGGLLCCVAEEHLEQVLEVLDDEQALSRAVIGRIVAAEPGSDVAIRVS